MPADGAARWARVQRGTTIARRAVGVITRSVVARTERRWTLTTAGLLPRPGYHQYDVFLRLSTYEAHRYHPTATFDGPTLVVRSGPGPRQTPDLGWSRLVTGPITVVDVPGDHLGVLRKPTVDRVGPAVRSALG